MTLADLIASPRPLAELRGLALLFTAELRDRLVAVQSEYGRPEFTAFPAGPTSDGRYYHCADILAETQPGGIYSAGFAHLDASRFNEVQVVSLTDAVALLPVQGPLQTAPASSLPSGSTTINGGLGGLKLGG